jgi:hypothetical protein
MDHLLAPFLVALTGFPALIAAFWVGRDTSPAGRSQALHWAAIALSLFFGALGLYWAGGQQGRMYAVAGLLFVTVNGLAISMLLRLRRITRGDR